MAHHIEIQRLENSAACHTSGGANAGRRLRLLRQIRGPNARPGVAAKHACESCPIQATRREAQFDRLCRVYCLANEELCVVAFRSSSVLNTFAMIFPLHASYPMLRPKSSDCQNIILSKRFYFWRYKTLVGIILVKNLWANPSLTRQSAEASLYDPIRAPVACSKGIVYCTSTRAPENEMKVFVP